MRGLGWAIDAVPPIKGGSSVGIASPPAILMPDGSIILPDIRDAERLQGFPADWTKPAEAVGRLGFRWQLVGNAVSVPVATWLGERLRNPIAYDDSKDVRCQGTWPKSAWSNSPGKVFKSSANEYPVWFDRPHLHSFLQYPTRPLSSRAARGFLKRANKGTLNFPDGFLEKISLMIA